MPGSQLTHIELTYNSYKTVVVVVIIVIIITTITVASVIITITITGFPLFWKKKNPEVFHEISSPILEFSRCFSS